MTDTERLVLLAVRLRGRGTAAAVAEAFHRLGGDPGFDVGTALDAAEARGVVRSRGAEGRRSLTAAGVADLAAGLAIATDGAGRAEIEALYDAFLPVNRDFLSALSTSVSDADRAEAVPRLVGALDPILELLTGRLPRFAAYRDRFATALGHARDDLRWVESPGLDSIHTIWFELHEHLLATLGRDRTSEH